MTLCSIREVKAKVWAFITDVPRKRELGYDEGLPFRIAPDFDTFVPEEFKEYTG